jgi:hypothetical protein
MRERMGDTYIAGIWKSTLLDDLAFYCKHPTPANPDVPTWSWASCHDGVDFLRSEPVRRVELVHLDFKYDGAVQLGTSLVASIRLRGPTLSLNAATLTPNDLGSPIVDDGVNRLLGYPGLRATLESETQLILMVLSSNHSNRPSYSEKYVYGVAIILHGVSRGTM